MDSMLRRRELLAAILLVALGVRLILGLVGFWVDGSLPADPLLIVAAVAAAIWCTRAPITRNARLLMALAVVGSGLSVLGGLIVAFGGLLRLNRFAFLGLANLVSLAVPAGALLAAMWVLREFSASQRTVEAAQLANPGSGPLQQATPIRHDPAPPLDQQPYWQPGQATGAAWTTAGDAATGAPASGWGQGSGWQPIPQQSPWRPEAPEETTRLPRPPAPDDRSWGNPPG